MRDILLTGFVFSVVPWMLSRPQFGLLMWSWMGCMNPHRLTWGFAYSFPFAQLIAACTLTGLLFCRDRQRLPLTLLTLLWFLFIAWMVLTTYFSILPDQAWLQLSKVLKIHLIALVSVIIVNTREKLHQLLWVITASIGFYGVKGGVFALMTGGAYRVWGPHPSFIGSNNHLGVALLMILPLMYYFYQQSRHFWLRWGLLLAMVLTTFGIASTQSRGAFVAGAALVVYLWWKSKKKLVTGMALLMLVPLVLTFMPSQWHERMATIQHYEHDPSAMGRIHSWEFAIHIAAERPTGGGFLIWQSQETFDRLTDGYKARAAHSIFFGVLGDHGWTGLLLFLGIGWLGLHTGAIIIRRTRKREDLLWMGDLARMLQVSMIAYATGGAFLSLSYFDLYWHLLSIMVITRMLMERALADVPAPQVAPTPSPYRALAAHPRQTAAATMNGHVRAASGHARQTHPPPHRRQPPSINWGPVRPG